MKIALDDLMDEAGVTVLFNTEIQDISTNNKHITSIKLNHCNDTIYTNNKYKYNKTLSSHIETTYLVDGTGDAKIFENLNLKFLENKNSFQPKNLRFIMSGINLEEFSDWIMELDKDRDVTTSYTVNGEVHLSTAYTWDKGKNWALADLFKQGIDEGFITEADSNYFQVFTIPGMPSALAFNCPRIIEDFTENDDVISSSMALKLGRERIYRLSLFLKTKFKGFNNAYISSIANSLGVRVSNRIIGKYVYTIDDLKSGKTFKNPVLKSNYPVDIHSSQKNESILEKLEQEYSLPIESLMSCDYDNLFAIGRCISADFEAQAALRIIPSCFSMGEGLAKYLANLDNLKY